VFIDDAQLASLEEMMSEQGYLDGSRFLSAKKESAFVSRNVSMPMPTRFCGGSLRGTECCRPGPADVVA
jgi:hypothetical protein